MVGANAFPVRKDYFLSFTSAILLILAFPNFSLHFLAWIALVPLFTGLANKNSKQAFVLSFCTGIVFLMGVFYWINVVENFQLTDFLLLGVLLGSYFGLFGLLLNFLSQSFCLPRALTAPVLWVSMEYLRSQAGAFSLPWAFLAHSQYLNLPVIQISSITGAYGVSFLIVMINAAIADIFIVLCKGARSQGKGNRDVLTAGAVCLALLALSVVYGVWRLHETDPGNRVRVAVIQGNIPQNLRWSPRLLNQHLEKHLNLSREAAKAGRPALIIWPETSVTGSITQNKALFDPLAALAQDSNAYLLIGSAERPKFTVAGDRRDGKSTNSAFLITPEGAIAERYDKIRLFPFGEYLPYTNLPWPVRIASHWQGEAFEPGRAFVVFAMPILKFAVTICWEDIFPDLVREFVKNGAKLIVNITNEAWFGDTAAPYQLLSMSVFRAVENRVAIARAANTGVSGFIDPYGRILGTVTKDNKETFVDGFLVKEIQQNEGTSFYTRYGDLFAFSQIGLCVVALVYMLVKQGIRKLISMK